MLAQLEAWLPPAPPEINWSAHAFRWRKRGSRGWLDAVRHVATIDLQDLQHIERQKGIIDRNTQQFIDKKPANNVLMTGARGTGKSSLVKAMLAAYGDRGLRLIEVDKSDLGDLADIVELVASRPERFIVFCDDLSFDHDDTSYKSLKAVLDGGVEGRPRNVVFYATSNRRHLLPRSMMENEQSTAISPGEAVEEKVSLSDRFGLWIGFHACSQDEYLAMVDGYLAAYAVPHDAQDARRAALEWYTTRGSRSGRVAWQFVQDYAAERGHVID